MTNNTTDLVEIPDSSDESQDNKKDNKTSNEELLEEVNDATWKDVYVACCIHSTSEWGWVFLGLLAIIFTLYWFMFSIELLGEGAKVLAGCQAGAMFGDDTNPLAGVMVGLISTALLQSSSMTTSIVITLTGSVFTVEQGIYIIMGANIGTTVTNTIVAIGQMDNKDQLERAFAGAVVHDMFNYLTVLVLFPLELTTQYLSRFTAFCVRNFQSREGEEWEGPIKRILSPLADRIINSNSKLIREVAKGAATCEVGGGFYPVQCEPGTPTYSTCSEVGLIRCTEATNQCPLFFQPNATLRDDRMSGGVILVLSVVLLFVCLIVLVAILSRMLGAVSNRIIYKCANINGYVSILIGMGMTVMVQSSSIVTSALTPLVGIGAITLEGMYDLSLGADIGTTITGIMAAFVTSGKLPMQVALAHLFFNVTGLIIFYPIPYMRRIPIDMARWLGRMTYMWRGFPFLYIAIAFFVVPGLLLGLSYMFEAGSIGLTVLGSMIVVVVVVGTVWFFYDFYYRNGRERWVTYFKKREEKRAVYETLPQDMIELKKNVALLMEVRDKKEMQKLLDTTEEDDTFDDTLQPKETFKRLEEEDLSEV